MSLCSTYVTVRGSKAQWLRAADREQVMQRYKCLQSCYNMLLLWTVMLSARTGAQSGEPDSGKEPTVSCSSHISLLEGSNITCRLVSNCYNVADDEDEDCDYIEKIRACCKLGECVEAEGETLNSKKLNPICPITLTAQSKRGQRIETKLDLRKIIKPKSPQVYNVTLNQNQALVHIQIPYKKDYLRVDNQRFQVQLWSEKTNMTQNMTSASMNIGSSHLRNGTQYHLKVRAIPLVGYEGSWSEWSQAVTFNTPPGDAPKYTYTLLWSIFPLVVVLSIVFIWKKRILSYMWPSIPHPKTTLEQICGPNNGLLLIYNPEEFSCLNIYSSVNQSAPSSHRETEPMLSAAGTEETPSSSSPSTDTSLSNSSVRTEETPSSSSSSPSTDTSLSNSSVRTEELELLSQSSTSEEELSVPTEGQPFLNSLQCVAAPETTPMEHSNVQQERDNSYVTMSSFYQIKTVGTDDKTFTTSQSVT